MIPHIPILAALLLAPMIAQAQDAAPSIAAAEVFQLWSAPEPLPNAADIPVLSGVEFRVVKKWEPPVDGYQWLHGVGLAWHQGKLFASFGHNRGAENTPGETAHGRISSDGGGTWSDVFPINTETPNADFAVSHGVFLSHDDTLWAFHGAFHGRMEGIHTRAFTLDEGTRRWQPRGVVVEGGFWPLNPPVRMEDGNWIMPGIRARQSADKESNPPAVAISHGEDFTKWDLVVIPVPTGEKIWGESGIIVNGARVLNIARYGAKPLALAAMSEDYGRTWTMAAETNLPMATSKPCAGLLSNGQRYLIDTTTGDTGARRSPLTIAVSRPGETSFCKVWIIRRSLFPEGPGESYKNTGLSYPCATEHEGRLYVGYSNNGPARRGNQNSAELAIIPIEKLAVDP